MLCIWAATMDDNEFNIYGLVAGGLSTYFFAKGIFSASAVFLLGKILQEMISHRKANEKPDTLKADLKYLAVWLGVIMGLMAGLFILGHREKEESVWVYNPGEISLSDDHLVRESTVISVAGLIQNKSTINWDIYRVEADVFIDGKYAGTCSDYSHTLRANEEKYFSADCTKLETEKIKGKVTYKLEYSAEKMSE